MPTCTIREVLISETNFDLRIEFDFAMTGDPSMLTYEISISKPNYLFWKEENADGSLQDYIMDLIRPHYEAMLKQKNLAEQLDLLNKELTW